MVLCFFVLGITIVIWPWTHSPTLSRHALTIGGLAPFQTPLLGWGGEGPPRPPGPPCSQARMTRTAREHEVAMAQNMMSNHTDMQDK